MKNKKMNVYLNSCSTTQPAKEVIEDINFYLKRNWANPSDISQDSINIRGDITYARNQIAKSIGASGNEIFFTSSGSESNNWALKGIVDAYPEIKTIITTKIEHPSVYNTCKYLESKGYKVKYLSVDRFGLISLAELEETLNFTRMSNKDVPLVSIMFANNEIGTIQPIKKIAEIVHKYNGIFHTDAVQAFMHTPINVKELDIDLMSVSGHKISAPKGIGFLYKRNDLNITPLIHGGKQEMNVRGGTDNVPYICAFGNQVERLSDDLDIYIERATELHNYIIQEVYEKCEDYCGIYVNGHPKKRIANNLSLTFEDINAEQIITLLDMMNVQVSAGSACCSGEKTPSRILKAIGLSDQESFNTIRVSFDYNTTRDEVDIFINALVKSLQSLKMTLD
jgi:cysteine desulfurase